MHVPYVLRFQFGLGLKHSQINLTISFIFKLLKSTVGSLLGLQT